MNYKQIAQEYYGQTLSSSKDLKTNACCCTDDIPKHIKNILSEVHEEVKERFYGCGSPIPFAVDGLTILDLGCGTGQDCFVLSKLVGPQGKVIGIDMTDEQLEIADKHVKYHQEKFSLAKSNVEFVKGDIQDLKSAGIQDNSVDLVISNCVINLADDKEKVFKEIFRVLKPGGELYFSDVFADRRMPEQLKDDPILVGECLGGALYIEDFRRLLASSCDCPDYRVVSSAKIDLQDEDVIAKAQNVNFVSLTIRAFKLSELEDRCEDYGQTARYLGGITESPLSFTLDDHHLFPAGKFISICRNTALMLGQTRYAKYFEIVGETNQHYGLFDCSNDEAPQTEMKTGCC